LQFSVVTSIPRVNCAEIAGDKPGQPAMRIGHMKFLA